MKALIILSTLLISFSSFAVCKVNTDDFYLVGKEGTRDFDPKLNKIVKIYPKVKEITSPYEPEYDLFVKIKEGCEALGDSEVQIYRMVGKRDFKTHDSDHSTHGQPNKAEWSSKPDLVIAGTVKKEKNRIIIPNLPVRKLLEENLGDNDHVWKLKIVFKGVFNPSPTVVIVDTPLLH